MPEPPTTAVPRRPIWFRSLYWRIAIGFVVMLALLLLSQAALLLWLTNRFNESVSSRTPQELADLVARELSRVLTDRPAADLNHAIREEFSDVRQPFMVMMRDGRRASNNLNGLPSGFGERLGRRGGFGAGIIVEPGARGGPPPELLPPIRPPEGFREPDRLPYGDPGRPDLDRLRDERFIRRRGGPGPAHLSPIVVNGTQVGLVAVPGGPPPMTVILRELGPTLTWSGLALLAIGSVMVALVIFRPARKRLRSLEDAARALGEGQPDARADERGGDEVSALAHAFNQMAEELHQRASALAASDRARRQLLADVSHELMTPLTAIRGYAQTLAMRELSMDDEKRRRYFDIVDQETYKLEAIIGDLLDLAKLEGGGSTLAIEPFPVAELFRRVADRHAPTLQSRGIQLAVTVTDDMTIDGDLQRLEQAVQNIASNAIRHSPDGGRIELAAREEDGAIRLTIRDSGPGIPAEHLPHIFDRFYKADPSRTTTRTAAGSGLGLSIVRAIVERHGGSVTASNLSSGGAQFEIVLPKGG